VIAPLVAAVEAARVVAVEIAHAEIQVCLASFHDEVVVIAHQAVAMNPPAIAPGDAREQVQEDDAVLCVVVDEHAAVAARRDVVVRPREDRSQRSRHASDRTAARRASRESTQIRHTLHWPTARARHWTGAVPGTRQVRASRGQSG
jgi:hypothetical protein